MCFIALILIAGVLTFSDSIHVCKHLVTNTFCYRQQDIVNGFEFCQISMRTRLFMYFLSQPERDL